MKHAYPDPTTRTLITISALLSVMMVTLDGTIAVIALPRIQSNLAASQEQIAWVLTSYLIAGAVATALSGWLADRFGRTRVMAASVLGFMISSIGCGLSGNLEMLVAFRFLQGVSGASLVPLAQVLLIDIYPPEKQGPATAMFGIGTLLGPTLGPTLGAWLTEHISWRAIFLINAPAGLLGFLGLTLFARDHWRHPHRPFDLKGFVAVAVALTSFQLMLDRGQLLDWFASTEIRIEAAVAALAGYAAVVHMLTARNPFIKPAIFKDRNFLVGTALSAATGILLNGVVPTVTSMMQQLLGYPVMLAGIVSLPRALGNMLTIMVVGRLVARIEARLLVFGGFAMIIGSMTLLSGLSLDAGQARLAEVALLQGLGSGLVFLPLTLAVFSTLPQDMRNEGSTLFALVRSLGGAVGLSVIQAATIRDMARMQARLVEHVLPGSPVMEWRMPGFDPTHAGDAGQALAQVMRQATMAAYVHSFRGIMVVALVMAPLALLLRSTHTRGKLAVPVHAD